MLKQTKRGKIYNSSSAPELKNKDNKIRFEVKVEDNEKIDQALKSVKHWNVQKHLEKLKDKEFLVKQLKLIIIAEREEDGKSWNVTYLTIYFQILSNSDDERQLFTAQREAVTNNKKSEAKKREREKNKLFGNIPQASRNLQKLSKDPTKDSVNCQTLTFQKVCFSYVEERSIFSITAQLKHLKSLILILAGTGKFW